MHSKSNNIEIMIGNETNGIINGFFELLLTRYELGLEESMKDRDFIFDSIDGIHYKCNKISLSCGGSYIESPDWIKKKIATINSKSNNDDNYFQYALTVALNHKNIVNDPRRTSKMKPFINQYNWKAKSFPSHKKPWKKFESNNKSIALNILLSPYIGQKIRQAYISKHHSMRDSKIILLMTINRQKWHYLAVKACPHYYAELCQNIKVIIIVLTVFIYLEQK